MDNNDMRKWIRFYKRHPDECFGNGLYLWQKLIIRFLSKLSNYK